MNILDIIPIIGASWGVLFIFFLLVNNRIMANNRKAKAILIFIIFFNTHGLIDTFLFYNEGVDVYWSGLSYAYFHLLGYFVLLFTTLLLKLKKIPGIVNYGVGVFTIIRIGLIIYFYGNVSSVEEMVSNIGYIYFDYYMVLLVNLIPLIRLYLKIRNLDFAVHLNPKSKNEFLWIKYLIISFIIYVIATALFSVVGLVKGAEWFLVNNYESMIVVVFLFVFAFLSIRIPVFAIYGDYNDIQQPEVRKYAKSSLKEEKSDELWEKIQAVMAKEKLYLNPEFRLNNLADATGESLHHISQVINEKEGQSFFDFVNKFRIKEAKELLVSEKGKQFTVLAVAFEVGFNSKNPFYNAFKKETGKTPTEFKKQHSK